MNNRSHPMKLYTYDPAPNPRRLGMFIKYKGIDLETQQIDLMAREQLGEAYRNVNPACTVPALVLDDGTVLSEVVGICSYLEFLQPEKPMMGSTALERAQVLSWDHRLLITALMAVAEVLRNVSPNFAGRALPGPLDVPQIPALAERGRLRLQHLWPALDREIGDRHWLVGESPTLADIDLLVCADFAGWVKASPPDSCTNLQDYLVRARAELG
jgi:glutathione S-transferase